jgi:hypothetical protein
MSADFHLIDLISQAGAVQRLLEGKTDSEKLAWLAARGKLEPVVMTPDGRQTYHFESVSKQEAAFFFDAGQLVFVGDHTTVTARNE